MSAGLEWPNFMKKFYFWLISIWEENKVFFIDFLSWDLLLHCLAYNNFDLEFACFRSVLPSSVQAGNLNLNFAQLILIEYKICGHLKTITINIYLPSPPDSYSVRDPISVQSGPIALISALYQQFEHNLGQARCRNMLLPWI